MLPRVALIVFFLMVFGIAAILAAGHLGIELPWSIAAVDHPSPSQDREAAPSGNKASEAEAAIGETTAALEGAPSAAPATGSVALDVSRISPDGVSVFAGRADPDTYVTVLEDGKPAGTAKVDSNGEWTLSTEHKFASTDPRLSYEVSRAAPPAPAPPAGEKVAKAASPSPSAVAGEVMRKFENLVEEARKEAKKQTDEAEAAKRETETAAQSETPTVTVREGTPGAVAEATPVAPESSPQASTPSSNATAESGASPSAPATQVPPAAAATAETSTDSIPVPIMFVYNEAVLTPDGQRAAALLLEYLTLKHFASVELTGHADERGTSEYNYELSRERLETVSQLLKDGGYTGDLKLTPKGKTEPYMGVDRRAYSGEALFQLDRRVELRVTAR
ncbi:MAG: OmpA family protein [Hyphomicrobium sp.]|uniref:OmpA family protein n=1 Tax=Hyphomicrobium sp. TaxID=82 RepID=UPI003D0E75C1